MGCPIFRRDTESSNSNHSGHELWRLWAAPMTSGGCTGSRLISTTQKFPECLNETQALYGGSRLNLTMRSNVAILSFVIQQWLLGSRCFQA